MKLQCPTDQSVNVSCVILTAKLLRSPFDVNAMNAAFLSVCRDRCAQTFTVAALVTSTSVEDASFDVVVHRDLRMARLEHGRFEYATLMHCPLSTMWVKYTSVLNIQNGHIIDVQCVKALA